MEEKPNNKNAIIAIILGIILIVIIIFLILRGCNPTNYQVTFDSKGGSVVETLKVEKNGTIKKPNDPTQEGYEFVGWYYNGELFDFTTKITKDITLEARWKSTKEELTLNVTSISIKPNESVTLLTNYDASDLVWTSSDSSIVTVSQEGIIKGLKEGKATITVTTKDGEFKVSCLVTVTKEIVKVTGVTISGNSEVEVNKTIKLTANVKPSNASNKEVIWKSSNPSIASVDEVGNVKALKEGTVTITVTTVDGSYIGTKTITVKKSAEEKPNEPTTIPISSVTIDGEEKQTIYVNESLTLTYKINPSDATNRKVKWTSSDESIATVDENGKVIGKAKGTVTITITTLDGNHTDTVTIEVLEHEKIDEYVLTLTPLEQSTGLIAQYKIVGVTKNGNPFNEYKYFTNGSDKYDIDKTKVLASFVNNGKANTLTLVLSDNTQVTLKVLYTASEKVD